MASGARRLGVVAAALVAAALVAGCGGGDGDGGIDEGELRGCLADAGIRVDSVGGTGLVPGAAAPDFRASRGAEQMDVTVESSEQKARRHAADIRSALVTYGVADPDLRLLTDQNAIVLFDRDPNPATARTVRDCLA